MPPQQRQEDTVIIGLLGGSVAEQVIPAFQRELNRWFADRELRRRPLVVDLAVNGMKQPQQTLIIANALLLGGEFDLIINLDGNNEVANSAGLNAQSGVSPFFPLWWERRVRLTAAEVLPAGQIGVLRRKQARLVAAGATSPLRGSAVFGLANRYRQEKTIAEIIQRNHDLAALAAGYNLEKYGPRNGLNRDDAELLQAAARVWYRGSLTLDRLADLTAADYYHFLQPSQYAPGAKPLSREELAIAYKPDGVEGSAATRGYPLLRGFNQDFQEQGINFFDLTGIFAGNSETLYQDECCHLNARGNELLAAAMVARLEPALRRWAGASPNPAAAGFAAARLAGATPALPDSREFAVSLAVDGKELRYFRQGCIPEDTMPPFFLHIVPAATDLPSQRQEYGFDQRDFNFWMAGGNFKPWQCAILIPLPDYPIAEIRTGQYVHGQGELWSVELIVPAAPGRLRSAYAALSKAELVAQDAFALYVQDNQLIYLRETCAAADTAARFFLHIVPEDLAVLPAERQAAGFAYNGFDFARWGGPFDDKCLATVPLPDYPIKSLRTGQYVPGQGELWSVELRAAP